ncbi:MAG: hypothetical protein K2P94_14910 [Rhodospirillaceae bacterium]|nr:hypothetical protein [Rhodospirillaceae bacterium]
MKMVLGRKFTTIAMVLALTVTAGTSPHAADKPLYQMDNPTIDARIRAAFGDQDAFAAAKIVGLMFADTLAVGPNQVTREVILSGLEKESARFYQQMPDFQIAERDLFVADNGVVMNGRMMGTRLDGTKMDVAFATIFTRDKSGRIVAQSTLEVPRKAK